MAAYKETPGIEVVTWHDHSHNDDNGGYTLTEIAQRLEEEVTFRTVGFLVYEDERRVTLAHEARVDADLREPSFSRYTTIYKALILDRQPLVNSPRG